jgi:hypothetical protein
MIVIYRRKYFNSGGPRFSDSYGNLRHMASILVENHSLKPFQQRVLGTYILLESTLSLWQPGRPKHCK